jgi:hypothetical protein
LPDVRRSQEKLDSRSAQDDWRPARQAGLPGAIEEITARSAKRWLFALPSPVVPSINECVIDIAVQLMPHLHAGN